MGDVTHSARNPLIAAYTVEVFCLCTVLDSSPESLDLIRYARCHSGIQTLWRHDLSQPKELEIDNRIS